MSTVNTVSNAYQSDLVSSLNGGSGTTAGVSDVEELSNRFLTLLVTQLKNQDPMNPMENAELTSQLAQMSTVEGVNTLNTTMTALSEQFMSSQVLQGASLVGHQVLAEGDELTLGTAGAAGGVDLDNAADTVTVRITDANGALVRTLNLGDLDAGLNRFVWDGLNDQGAAVATGSYGFSVTATAGGKAVTNTALTLGTVQSVSMGSSGLVAEVSNLGDLSLGQIHQIY